MQKKLLLIIFGMVVIGIGLAVGLYLYLQSPNVPTVSPINNTQPAEQISDTVTELDGTMHTDDTYGYTIFVPSNLTVDQVTEHSIHILSANPPLGQGPTNFIYLSIVPPTRTRSNQFHLPVNRPPHSDR